jgi:hypothetical protein
LGGSIIVQRSTIFPPKSMKPVGPLRLSDKQVGWLFHEPGL